MAHLWQLAGLVLPTFTGATVVSPVSITDAKPDAAPTKPDGKVYGHPDPNKDYPPYEGFTLWLAEEFSAPLDLDTDPVWTYSDGALGEGRVRYQKEGISFKDGKMILTAEPWNDTWAQQQCSHAEAGVVFCNELRSGEMRTKHNMFRYGRYEVSMKAPEVQPGDAAIDGSYVATMFVYKDGKFRNWREIDVEVLGNGEVFSNVLYANDRWWWGADIARADSVKKGKVVREGFHTYAFEWLPGKITWFFDGEVIRTYEADENVLVSDMANKIMMSLWVFGDGYHFGGTEGENNRYPLKAEYDWFRFYRWDTDDTYPCQDLGETCLTAMDRFLSSNNPCDGIPQIGTWGPNSTNTPCTGAVCNTDSSFTKCEPRPTPAPPAPTPAPTPSPAESASQPHTVPFWVSLLFSATAMLLGFKA